MRTVKIAAASALMAAALYGCSKGQEAPAQGAPPVTVAAPLSQQVVDWDEFTGRFEAPRSVDVRARVGGYIQSVHFKDGDFVRQGQLLFTLDPRPAQAALAQAQVVGDQRGPDLVAEGRGSAPARDGGGDRGLRVVRQRLRHGRHHGGDRDNGPFRARAPAAAAAERQVDHDDDGIGRQVLARPGLHVAGAIAAAGTRTSLLSTRQNGSPRSPAHAMPRFMPRRFADWRSSRSAALSAFHPIRCCVPWRRCRRFCVMR